MTMIRYGSREQTGALFGGAKHLGGVSLGAIPVGVMGGAVTAKIARTSAAHSTVSGFGEL